jgi:hypothetical protein
VVQCDYCKMPAVAATHTYVSVARGRTSRPERKTGNMCSYAGRCVESEYVARACVAEDIRFGIADEMP